MKIETYLNDNLFTDINEAIETVDVRTHYNAFKGDVMFTFYNTEKPYLIVPEEIELEENEEKLYEIKTNINDITYNVSDSNVAEIIVENNKYYIKANSVGDTTITIGNDSITKLTSITVVLSQDDSEVTNKRLSNIPKDITM
jgi:Flp pilus assembly secretin CpaC